MEMSGKKSTTWITRTAIFIALLIVLQMATTPLGNIIVTGSIVNLLLIVSVMTCGLSSGLAVAIVSPVMAKILGIGPLWSLIPFIALGNVSLVIVWNFIGNRNMRGKYTVYIVAMLCAAVAKFLVLYVGIVQIAIPIFLRLPEQQAAVISSMFSIPQLITALVGGAVAIILFPRLKQAIAVGKE